MFVLNKISKINIYGEHFANGTILQVVTLDNLQDICEIVAKCLNITKTFKTILTHLREHDEYVKRVDNVVRYHCADHAMLVFLASVEGAYNQSNTLPDNDVRELAVAALMHDYSHKCIFDGDDEYNIRVACSNVNTNTIIDCDILSIVNIKALIKVTKFPWTTTKPSLLGRILMDADLMLAYVLDEPLKQKLLRGLYTEMNTYEDFNNAHPDDVNKFFDIQAAFHHQFSWNTRWGSMKAIKYNFPKLLQYRF